MAFKKISKHTASEQVIEQIVETIDSGDLKTGDQLPSEKEMSATFGVGRSSVREAVRTLVVMGYLEVFQGKGTYVKSKLPSLNNISDIMEKAIKAGALFDLMETREILEFRSAQLAAERANKSQIARLKESTQQLKKSQGNIQRFIDADWEFHMAIAETTNNTVIVDVMNLLINKIHNYNAEFLASSQQISSEAIETAEEVIEHVIAGNSQKAGSAMQKHLELIRREIKKLYS